MTNKIFQSLLLAGLGVALPGVLHAVAVYPALIQNERMDPQGLLYGLIFLVLVIGIAVGIWVQKKLNHS